MRLYVGFDDTDTIDADRGTGKFVRWFEEKLPQGCQMWGVVRQQLPVMEGIPYTSHNSSACMVIDIPDPELVLTIIDRGCGHIQEHFMEGSDPGLCVALQNGDDDTHESIREFGQTCSQRIVTQQEAMQAACKVHLSGHGGTNDGIIGATAGVGLTMDGWNGRFIEWGAHKLRDFSDPITVADLQRFGIRVLPTDRNSVAPGPEDIVETGDWLRPRLWAGQAILPVLSSGTKAWRAMGKKRGKGSVS